jgi:flagellar hook-length control protein FliK
MPTPISRILPSSASTASTSSTAPKAAVSAPEQQFQRTLSRQIEQRQALEQSQASSQAKTRTDARSRTDADAKARTEASAAQPEAAPVDPSAQPTGAREASTETNPPKPRAKDGEQDVDNNQAADTTPQPLSSMLTLVASLQQAAANAVDTDNAAAAALKGAGGSVAADAGPAIARAGTDKAALPMAASDQKSALPDLKLSASALPAAALPKAAASDAPLPAMTAPTAQAALPMAQTASAIPAGKLNGQVGSPAWDQQLGQKVIWMAAGGLQSATLTLNPPDLGPLQVVLNVSNDQASVSFTSNQPEVRQALEAAMPKLRDMMGEAGLNLSNTNVSAGNSNQEHAGAQQERRHQGGGAQIGSTSSAQIMALPAVRGATLQGMVDTFA